MLEAIRQWFARSDAPSLHIGAYKLPLTLDNKHEIAYFEKSKAGITDVDVAIAQRLMRAGDLVLDLGANIGFVALHFLALGAREVHAFEPSPAIFERLRKLRVPALHCYPYAIGSKSRRGELILSVSHHQGSTLYPEVVEIRPKVYGQSPQSVSVEVRTIDAMFPEVRFDYVKVDIEGGELDFVMGAQTLLTARPPRILVLEIKPEFRAEYLTAMAPYFSCVRRVDYDRSSGAIDLAEVDAQPRANFTNQPPNYVFSNSVSVLDQLPMKIPSFLRRRTRSQAMTAASDVPERALVASATSTGGPQAMQTMQIPLLTKDFSTSNHGDYSPHLNILDRNDVFALIREEVGPGKTFLDVGGRKGERRDLAEGLSTGSWTWSRVRRTRSRAIFVTARKSLMTPSMSCFQSTCWSTWPTPGPLRPR